MRVFHHIQSGMAGMDLWILMAIVGGIILVVFIMITIIRRHNIGSNGLTPVEKNSLTGEQREVLAILRQHGGSMLQTDIADIIAGDHSFTADILLDLEKRGKISRVWDSGKGAFWVTALG